MIPDLPVFLNGRALSVPAGATLGDLLAEHEPDLLVALMAGEGFATDARGLPVEPAVPLTAGAIFRVRRSARLGGTADA